MEPNEWICQLLDFIRTDKNDSVTQKTIEYANNLSDTIKPGKATALTEEEISLLEKIRNIGDIKYVLLWFSVLVEITGSERLFRDLSEYALSQRSKFSYETQFFLHSHIDAIAFRNVFNNSEDTELQWHKWLYEIVSYYRKKLSEYLMPVKAPDRNHNLVFVISNQILEQTHSVTAVSLKWCKFLIDHGRDVLLINTAEALTQVGEIPFLYYPGNYDPSYSEMSLYEYEGIKIPFFQCPNTMPDINVLSALLEIISEEKPGLIISLGDIIFSSLADNIVPVYSIGLSAGLTINFTTYKSMYRELTNTEKKLLEQAGYNAKSLIRTNFTFDLPTQKTVFSRHDLRIPQSTFLLTVVGNRLSTELSDEFLSVLNAVLAQTDSFVLFVGDFNFYSIQESYESFNKKTAWIKYAEDLNAVMELCDLYVNPIRYGGGTSALFAMIHGIPVVTTDLGDVALNAGKEFCVHDPEEMKNRVIMYINDPDYYSKMSELARQRAKFLTDSDNIMMEQIKEIEHREGYI